MRTLRTKKWLLLSFIGALLFLLVTLVLLYRSISLREPDRSLLTLLPDAPICYLSIKNLGGFIETFGRSEFGKQTLRMPLLSEIQRELWWRQIVYQKQHWEHEIGGELNLKALKGYFGEEAILSFYHRGGEISFLLISLVGAKEKLEIAALTATDFVNPKHKRKKENYRGIDINTITGYPRDFSYAFIGKIGLLGLDKSLIQETIDIHSNVRKNFISLDRTREYMRQRYDSDSNTMYINVPRFTQAFTLNGGLKSVLAPVKVWSVGNRYENGVIRSRHRFTWDARPKSTPKDSRPIDQSLLSILPATTAFLCASSGEDSLILGTPMENTQFIQYEGNRIELFRHLKSAFAFSLLDAQHEKPSAIPPTLLILTLSDDSNFRADFAKLRNGKVAVFGKPLKFLNPQDFHGTEIYPVQLRFGFLFAVTGGCAIVDNYWIISSTLDGLKAAIDASEGRTMALSETGFLTSTHQSVESQIFIQPNRFIPQLKRLTPILGVIAATSGQGTGSALITRITNNLFPLEALGAITAEIDFDGAAADAHIRIVLEPTEG